MDPIINNIKLQRGEIATLVCAVYPSPTNITGWTIIFHMKNNYGDVAFLLTRAAVITDPTNGEFTVTFASSDTDRAPRSYVYDIWRTDSGSEVCLTKGDFIIEPEVTY